MAKPSKSGGAGYRGAASELWAALTIRQRILVALLAVALMGWSVAWGIRKYQHDMGCHPIRAAASAANTVINADTKVPAPSTQTGMQQAFNEIDANYNKELADTADYFEAILAQPGCFSSSEVSSATSWYIDAHPADNAINPYFYCWNSGAPSPHRLGHLVAGDHLCTYGELRSAGVAR